MVRLLKRDIVSKSGQILLQIIYRYCSGNPCVFPKSALVLTLTPVLSLLLYVLYKYYPIIRYLLLGYISLTLFIFLFRIFLPRFYLFQSDFVPSLLMAILKLLVLALCLFSKNKSLLVFNCLLGGFLSVLSIGYMVGWIPNIFQYFDQSKFCISFRLGSIVNNLAYFYF